MKLDPTGDGFTIDAADLAALLGMPAAEMREAMRAGLVTSRVERGEGEDAGRFRVTFLHGQSQVRLIVDGAGEVLRRSRVTLTAPPKATAVPRL